MNLETLKIGKNRHLKSATPTSPKKTCTAGHGRTGHSSSYAPAVNDVPFLLPSDENSGDRAEFTRRECSYQYKIIDFHFLLKRTVI